MIRLNPLLQIYLAEKVTANLVVAAHCYPLPHPNDHNPQISPTIFQPAAMRQLARSDAEGHSPDAGAELMVAAGAPL
jgi:hypothetical protein